MPLYSWKGINQYGTTVKGTLHAASAQQLTQLLFAQQIALLSHTEQRTVKWLYLPQRSVHLEHLKDFFQRLTLLIKSGVELIPALHVLMDLTHHRLLKKTIGELAQALEQGQSLQTALQAHPNIFSPFMIAVIAASEQTGTLGKSLENLYEYLHQKQLLYKQLKQAAQGPLITLTIACILMSGFLLFVVPHFESLYQSLNKKLPKATQTLLNIHHLFTSWLGFAILAGVILGGIVFKILFTRTYLKNVIERIALATPIIKNIIIYSNLIAFTQMIHLFISSGIALTSALEQSMLVTQNTLFKTDIKKILQFILEGHPFHYAIEQTNSPFFDKQIIALVHVGEKSGKLDIVLASAIGQYQNILQQDLHIITTLFAPACMILVGILIGGLMIIAYLPIFNLGNLFAQ